jgi:hypothetical protein
MRRATVLLTALLLLGTAGAVWPNPATAAPPPLTAANGRNFAACKDGRCEVIVRTGDRLPTSTGTARVVVGRGVVRFTVTTANTSLMASGTAGSRLQLNRQVIVVLKVTRLQAKVRLSRV